MNKTIVISLMLQASYLASFSQTQNSSMNFATSLLAFEGKSSGGELTLTRLPAWNHPYVIITNYPGETAATVVRRLAGELSECAACTTYFGLYPVVEKTENTLLLVGGGFRGFPDWILGGTESGFNIPPTPTALSVSVEAGKIILKWVNQGESYDSIGVFFDGIPIGTLTGNTTQYDYIGQYGTRAIFNSRSNDVTFSVMALKKGAPSNGAGVRLKRLVSQESMMNIPFSRGVAPSFQMWSDNTNRGAVSCEQGNHPGMMSKAEIRHFNGKGFYQIIRGNGDFRGGVTRRFLGLLSGHTYRVGARLNTLATSSTNEWSFSFHAAYDATSAQPLSPEQMAGGAALPSGSKGPAAGLIAKYDASGVTSGSWVEHFSTASAPGKPGTDITLPKDSDSITLWFRLAGNGVTNVAVGLDSVTIEDLGTVRE